MSVIAPPDLERLDAEEVLSYAVERFHPRLYVACSFQKEASVIMDMLLRIEPEARFFTIDTGVLFQETHDTRRALEERYGVEVDVYDASSPDGLPWTADRCCSDQKVVALREALGTADAWVSGLRREHSPERAGTAKLHWDDRHGLWKVNPLADWSERDVWSYLAANDVPYNPLHDQGYDSIGCMPCTLPGSGREGRWAGTDQTECGIHG
ncbi:MAG: phosphoadenosine phosphosulfate reductase [Thermoleophilaceae bacterium]|jgi:phosphoadenosine phosphosulfate reductase|nr:phosphoadenosine phosphosulfate reductase [Thermoleophilaceae bacterium]MEA2422737.1 phosphoadenosine phosphosulfate reductase [Thermoleophilaceae bacterium]